MSPRDDVSDIIAYEQGELDADATLALFQRLTDSGLVWNLQGHYGRTAAALIEQGLVTDPRDARALQVRDAERERLRLPETTFRPRQGPIPGFRSHHARGGGQ